jgi:hypothetical protein
METFNIIAGCASLISLGISFLALRTANAAMNQVAKIQNSGTVQAPISGVTQHTTQGTNQVGGVINNTNQQPQ